MKAVRDTQERPLDTMLRGYRLTQLVHVAAKLGIADELALRAQTAAELAATLGADADALGRVMRALAGLGIFGQDADGKFTLTKEGQRLRSDVADSMRLPAITYGEPFWWRAWGGLFETVRTGVTAFDRVHGTDLFSYLAGDSHASSLFNGIMNVMTTEQAAAVATGYDFSSTRLLVDIGGGHGALATAILRNNPAARAVLFDRPSVIDGATARLAALGVADRCTLEGGDFFVAVPGGADTYTLKDIIHDWNDERALTILVNARRAMASDARLLLIERLLPPGDTPSQGKLIDITMLALTGGRERTADEYGALLAGAGFVVRRVVSIDGELSLIEAAPDPEPRVAETRP